VTEYLLGSSDEELARLRFQHDVWRDATETLWRRAGFGPGQALLDLACGPGLATVDLVGLVGPEGRVVGFDLSPKFTTLLRDHVAETGLDNLEVRTGSVYDGGYGAAGFDGVFARWLFWFLDDPESVIRHVAAALKPGGRFAILDYFRYLAIHLEPPSDRFRHVFEQVHRSLADAGGDLDVGGKLPALLVRHGFAVDSLVPVWRAARPGSPVWRWVTQFQGTYFPGLVDQGRLTREELDAFRAEWAEREAEGNSIFFSPPMLAITATRR